MEKSWRPSPDEISELAKLYGACIRADGEKTRPRPRLVPEPDRPLFALFARRVAAAIDGNPSVLRPQALAAFDGEQVDDQRLTALVHAYRSHDGSSRDDLARLFDRAQSLSETVILAFDHLHDTLDKADSETAGRTEVRRQARAELEELHSTRAGILLALPALFAAAARTLHDVISSDRQWLCIPGVSFDQLTVVDRAKFKIPGFDNATDYIWSKRHEISWPAIPVFSALFKSIDHDCIDYDKISAERLSSHCPTIQMLDSVAGMRDWSKASLEQLTERAKKQDRFHSGQEDFLNTLNGLYTDKNGRFVSPAMRSSDEEAPAYFNLFDRILSLVRVKIDSSLFTHQDSPWEHSAMTQAIKRHSAV